MLLLLNVAIDNITSPAEKEPHFQSNHMDLSPNYAGTLMGITNTMANIAGFVTPYVVGSIIEGNVRITGHAK